jgi:hypothetical protein
VETVVVGMVAAVEMVAVEEGAEEEEVVVVVVEEDAEEEEGVVKCHEVLSFLSWCVAR